jgi:16S rRNA (uracil1498-N3)-methyltransferase
MQRLFLPPNQITGDTAHIIGPDHLHLARVLRARAGQSVIVLDGRGNAFRAVLVSIEKNETIAQIEETVTAAPEPPVILTIAQALGKGDKFEQVVQHGTEAGASAFVPVRAERCVADVPEAKVAERVARWQQIAKSAAEQSGRTIIPHVAAPLTFKQLLDEYVHMRLDPQQPDCLLLHPDPSAQPLSRILPTLKKPLSRSARCIIVLAIGPEGGWSPAEVLQAQNANIPLVTLGPHILRTETAALVAISQILYHFNAQQIEREF